MNKLAIAAVVLIALVGLILFKSSERKEDSVPGATAEGDSEAFDFPAVDKGAVTALDVKAIGKDAVSFEKKDGVWTMVAPFAADADVPAVESAIEKLSELEVKRLVAKNASSHDRLEVADNKGIAVTAKAGGKVLADLIIGAYGAGTTMVRKKSEDTVYGVDGSFKWLFNKDLHQWRNRDILDVDAASIVEAHFVSDAGEFHFVKEGAGFVEKHKKKIPEFATASLQSLLSRVSNATATGFAEQGADDKTTGVGEGAATVTLVISKSADAEDDDTKSDSASEEGTSPEEGTVPKEANTDTDATATARETVVLRVGAETDGGVFVKREGYPVTFKVSKSMAESLRPDADAFKKAEEPPSPPPGAGMPQGMGGAGGGQQIPPEIMKQIQAQMAAQGQSPH